MNPEANSSQSPRQLAIPYWIAWAVASVCLLMLHSQIWFGIGLSIGGLAVTWIRLQSLSSNWLPQAALIFSATAYQFQKLWPNELSDYYGAPLYLAFAVALIAALNRNSFGGSRALVSLTALAFLLVLRNSLLFETTAFPWSLLGQTFAVIAFLDISLSRRFESASSEMPHAELVLALCLSALACTQIDSLPLAAVLGALPLVAFLLALQEHAKEALDAVVDTEERGSPSSSVSKIPHKSKILLLALPSVLFAAFYLGALRIPFWADYIKQDAPQLAKSLAQGASEVAKSSELEKDAIKGFSEQLLNPAALKEKAEKAVADINWPNFKKTDPQGQSDKSRPSVKELEIEPPEFEYSAFAEPKSGLNMGPASRFPQLDAQSSETDGDSNERHSISSAQFPQSSGKYLDSEQLPSFSQLSEQAGSGSQSTRLPSNRQSQNQSSNLPRVYESQVSRSASTESFDQWIDGFESPVATLTNSLKLQGANVEALLSEEPIAIASVSDVRGIPERVYLRDNILDTVTSKGIGASRIDEGFRIRADNGELSITQSPRSESSDLELTLTLRGDYSAALLLPDSFRRILVYDTPSVDFYPTESIAFSSPKASALTYQVSGVDLEISSKEHRYREPTAQEIEENLAIPLDDEELAYLKKLAGNIGGKRSDTKRFAQRFTKYFADKHPYSYSVEIPAGEEHPAIRWLKNECPGLCSNYAAAFTLIARSRGIPTRVVSGFASDEFDRQSQRLVFRQKNAHAWVEYLDESDNWIRYDPTPAIQTGELQRIANLRTEPTESFDPLAALVSAEQKTLTAHQDEGPETTTAQLDADTISLDAASPSTEEEKISIETPELELADLARAAIGKGPDVRESPIQSEHPFTTTEPSPEVLRASPNEVGNVSASSSSGNRSVGFSQQEPESAEKIDSMAEDAPETVDYLSKDHVWLGLVLLLCLSLPFTLLLRRKAKAPPKSVSIEARRQAGKLLARLEDLIVRHELERDPVWAETRDGLIAQRYSREPNPLLIKDAAVKIALLAKKKSPEAKGRNSSPRSA